MVKIWRFLNSKTARTIWKVWHINSERLQSFTFLKASPSCLCLDLSGSSLNILLYQLKSTIKMVSAEITLSEFIGGAKAHFLCKLIDSFWILMIQALGVENFNDNVHKLSWAFSKQSFTFCYVVRKRRVSDHHGPHHILHQSLLCANKVYFKMGEM